MESLDMRRSADDASHFGNLDWQKKVFKEVDKVQPDVLTFVIHKKDNYEKHGAGNWLTEILQQQVNRGGTVIVFDAGATSRRSELNLEEISRPGSDTPCTIRTLVILASQHRAKQLWKHSNLGQARKTDFIVQRPLIRSENLNSAKPWKPFSTISMANLSTQHSLLREPSKLHSRKDLCTLS